MNLARINIPDDDPKAIIALHYLYDLGIVEPVYMKPIIDGFIIVNPNHQPKG